MGLEMGNSEKTPGSERRKYPRFKARLGAFVLCSETNTILGQINDISLGGLSYHYFDGEEEFDAHLELDISHREQSYYLSNLKFKTISDVEVHREGLDSMTIRRKGVQFQNIAPSQVAELKYFIQRHTYTQI